ncbi:MAG TPA: hypothetical protein VH637_10410 [Streptosporangiaceae bacterium]|jgi:hypothetical protein
MTQDDPSPQVQATQSLGSILRDLVMLAERIPAVPGHSCEKNAQLLDHLASELRDCAGLLRRRAPEIVRMNADPRTAKARKLLAENHHVVIMPPSDVQALLARYQQRTAELLAVIEQRPVHR